MAVHQRRVLLGAAALAATVSLSLLSPPGSATPAREAAADTVLPYQNPKLPTPDRVDDLLARMTLEEKVGRSVDPMRFRPNVVIEGVAAFAELDWIGKEIALPTLTLVGRKRTGRCAATNVDPSTGRRDMQIPRWLEAEYGDEDFGIYLTVERSGRIGVGDPLAVAP